MPECVYGMIIVESLEPKTSRQQVRHLSPWRQLADVPVQLPKLITDMVACSWMIQRECKRELQSHLQRWTLNSEVT